MFSITTEIRSYIDNWNTVNNFHKKVILESNSKKSNNNQNRNMIRGSIDARKAVITDSVIAIIDEKANSITKEVIASWK